MVCVASKRCAVVVKESVVKAIVESELSVTSGLKSETCALECEYPDVPGVDGTDPSPMLPLGLL